MKLSGWRICLMRREQRLPNREPTHSFSESLSSEGWVSVTQPSISRFPLVFFTNGKKTRLKSVRTSPFYCPLSFSRRVKNTRLQQENGSGRGVRYQQGRLLLKIGRRFNPHPSSGVGITISRRNKEHAPRAVLLQTNLRIVCTRLRLRRSR
jgi:hypothetical protein